jgi:hypothetical protein
MAYRTDMRSAADRHFFDGCKLQDELRLDNAAYHFGLAAECAVKHQLLSQHKVLTDHPAYWKHWPELRPLVLDALSGRSAAPLRTLMQRDNYLQHWSIEMRYAPSGTINPAQTGRWRDHADEAMGLML